MPPTQAARMVWTADKNHNGKCDADEYGDRKLMDSFELDGKTYRSLTALAKFVTGYAAISGPAWAGLVSNASGVDRTRLPGHGAHPPRAS